MAVYACRRAASRNKNVRRRNRRSIHRPPGPRERSLRAKTDHAIDLRRTAEWRDHNLAANEANRQYQLYESPCGDRLGSRGRYPGTNDAPPMLMKIGWSRRPVCRFVCSRFAGAACKRRDERERATSRTSRAVTSTRRRATRSGGMFTGGSNTTPQIERGWMFGEVYGRRATPEEPGSRAPPARPASPVIPDRSFRGLYP